MCLLKRVAVYVPHAGVLFCTGDLKIVVEGCVLFKFETYDAGVWCIALSQNGRNMFYSLGHGEFALCGVVAKCNVCNIDPFINGAVSNYLYREYAVVQCVFLNMG